MGLITAVEGNDFLQGDFDLSEVILKGTNLQVKSMCDPGMDAEKNPNHPSDFVSKGIHFNEDFMGLEPTNHWRRLNFVKLDSFDCFRAAKDATNCHSSSLNWVGGGGMYKDFTLKFSSKAG